MTSDLILAPGSTDVEFMRVGLFSLTSLAAVRTFSPTLGRLAKSTVPVATLSLAIVLSA
jgi:hypothetical protein